MGGGDLLGGLLCAAGSCWAQHLEAVEIWNFPYAIALPEL